MPNRTLGRSGLRVSPVALGTMNFGSAAGVPICSPAVASRIVAEFLDAGHTLIDTADKYNGGEAEEIVGAAIRGRRESVLLATKAGHPTGAGPNDRGLSRAHLTRALEASLRRLGTDHVDLYQCHVPDPDTPIEETMATLDGFVRAGKVRYLGCSNFTAAQLVEAQWAAQRIGGAPLVSHQAQYSLVDRTIEAEILPVSGRHGLGTLTWSPLGAGVLAGRYRRDAPPPPDSRLGRVTASSARLGRYWALDLLAERKLRIADEVSRVAAELGAPAAAVAVAWLRDRTGVSSIVVGPRTPDQLGDYLAGMGLTLPPEAGTALDHVSRPGSAVRGA